MKALAIAIACLALAAACSRDASPPAGSAMGSIAPGATERLLALSLPDLDGKPQPLGQWTGKILVVNYWATWCPPCKEEMPAFSRLHEKYAAKGVQFVGISIDSPEKVRKFQTETPVRYPLLLGTMETMQTAVNLGNVAQGMPFTVILDAKGTLHSTKLGRLSETALEQRLQGLLER
jgi:peroxiredoxin